MSIDCCQDCSRSRGAVLAYPLERPDSAVLSPNQRYPTAGPAFTIVAATVDGIAVGERPFTFKMQADGVTHLVLVRLG
jgi:hypothetical protein